MTHYNVLFTRPAHDYLLEHCPLFVAILKDTTRKRQWCLAGVRIFDISFYEYLVTSRVVRTMAVEELSDLPDL